MSDRTRQRKGHHASIAGDPADETLRDLVAQFSDRYAFVRELIQNSLDAGAARIELEQSYADGELQIAVIDDGEGMDRPTIEGYLLTLFRSTKERDKTKIGKFGIGFVSLFAMGPHQVVVETGRDLTAHRVTFDADQNWVLEELDDWVEGTTVRLHLRCGADDAVRISERVVAAVQRWCRFARATLVHRRRGMSTAHGDEVIEGSFSVDAPVTVSFEEDGLRGVLGPSADTSPHATFVSAGLTLWEGGLDVVPGVTFLVEGRHLGHTLTRDNVRRDRAFDHAVTRVAQVAEAKLWPAVRQALAEAAAAGDDAQLARVLGACSPKIESKLEEGDVPWVPAWPEPVSLRAVREAVSPSGWLWWKGDASPLHHSAEGGPHVDAVAAEHLVLRCGREGLLPWWLNGWMQLQWLDVSRYTWVRVVPTHEGEEALLQRASSLMGRRLRMGELTGGRAEALCCPAGADGGLVLADWIDPVASEVVVRRAHPLWGKLLELPVELGASLLAHALSADLGSDEPVPTELVVAAMGAS
jgi:hypothetical protein